ncbi:alanine--glyoxylate aminotransferase family protein [Candidatus Gracilibacteria bacterium]|nr:alanine--glyoxylate aminotransferase family protein [Candidatus Gracilibacteria bacterium]
MFDLTFTPGPSKICPEVKKDITNAIDTKILEISHRSPEFCSISQLAVENLKTFLKIPRHWHVLFLGSAIEAMELAIRSTVKETSFHFTNGNFSEYFIKLAKDLHKKPLYQKAVWGTKNDYTEDVPNEAELITITQCESSTGCMVSPEDIKNIRKKYPEKFIAVDATSIMGVIDIDIKQADIWLWSVQKCFGLPAGLGIMVVNQKVWEKSRDLHQQGINPIGAFGIEKNVNKMLKNYNTIATPNVLNIYLLGQQTQRFIDKGGLPTMEKETRIKIAKIYELLDSLPNITTFIKNRNDSSISLVCAKSDEATVAKIHQVCKENNIHMGTGYGKLKPTTFRICNFPAITIEDIKLLSSVLKKAFHIK